MPFMIFMVNFSLVPAWKRSGLVRVRLRHMIFQKSMVLIVVFLLAACSAGESPAAAPTGPTREAKAVETSPAVTTPAVDATVLAATPTQVPAAAQESVGESPLVPDRFPASSEAVAEEPVIKFNRSGGFAGLDQTFLIYADGRIVGANGEERQASPEQVAAVLQQIEAASFFELDASYLPRDTCCDRFSYEITVHTPPQTKSVVTMDGVENQPDGLTMTLAAITELLSSVGM